MSSSKKIDLYREFAAGVYLSGAPSPPPPLPSPPMRLTHCVRLICILTRGGGVKPERRLEGQ